MQMRSHAILKHPNFVNRLVSGIDGYSQLLAFITSFLLTSRALKIDVISCTVSLCVAIAMSCQHLYSQFQVVHYATGILCQH